MSVFVCVCVCVYVCMCVCVCAYCLIASCCLCLILHEPCFALHEMSGWTLIMLSLCVICVVKSPRCPSGKVSASTEDPGIDSRWRRVFSGSSHTSDLNIGTPVAALPGAWHYRISPVSVYCDWVRWKVYLQLLSQCGSTYKCLSRSILEIH